MPWRLVNENIQTSVNERWFFIQRKKPRKEAYLISTIFIMLADPSPVGYPAEIIIS